jgi:membrane protease YdiL (CAAX protease family)
MGAFGLTVLFVRWERLRLTDVGAMPDRHSLQRLGFGIVSGLFIVALHTFIMGVAGHVQWVRESGVGMAEVAVAALAYLALSAREELAFRGFPLRRLERSFGLWKSQFVVAFVFAAEHIIGGTPWASALLGAGVGSLLFGMAALATRGLAVPIGLHAAWNIGDWMRGGKGAGGLWSPVVDGGYERDVEVVGMVSYVAIMGLAVAGFYWWYGKVRALKRESAPGASVDAD